MTKDKFTKSELEFEKGRAYERLSHELSFHAFMGWGLIIMGPIFFFFSVWDLKTKIQGLAFSLLVGGTSIYMWLEERKERGTLKNKSKKEING